MLKARNSQKTETQTSVEEALRAEVLENEEVQKIRKKIQDDEAGLAKKRTDNERLGQQLFDAKSRASRLSADSKKALRAGEPAGEIFKQLAELSAMIGNLEELLPALSREIEADEQRLTAQREYLAGEVARAISEAETTREQSDAAFGKLLEARDLHSALDRAQREVFQSLGAGNPPSFRSLHNDPELLQYLKDNLLEG